ncbi:succinate dehydrogenase assembly factor 2 [Brevundimonas pondensis]|uniref:FAD assembly factor SdhE n=1 Tax=Brevundimonas pondensis TaxID=2774189 RepID=UPI00320B8319
MADIDARPEDARKQRLGRIAYRAWRRGFREADMVLGPFVDQVGPSMDDDELDQLEHLLNEEDQYLYAWIIEKEPTPPEFDGPMLARIRAFMREHVAAEVAKGIG